MMNNELRLRDVNGLTWFCFILRLPLVVGIAWLLMIKAELMRGVWLCVLNGILILRSDSLMICPNFSSLC